MLLERVEWMEMNLSTSDLLERSEARILEFFRADPVETQGDAKRTAKAIATLAERAAASLLDRADEIRASVEHAHRFSAPEAERAIVQGLRPIRAEALMAIWEKEEVGDKKRPNRTTVFGGGNIPQPSVQALVAASMVSRKVLFRPSRRDRILAPLLVSEMERLQLKGASEPFGVSQIGPISERILCATWPHDQANVTSDILGITDSFVYFGGEAPWAALQSSISPETERFYYGPKISFAVTDLNWNPKTEDDLECFESLTNGLAEDAAAYDQQGCLSPAAVFLIGATSADREGVLDALGQAFEDHCKRYGTTPEIDPGAAIAIHHLRADYAMDATQKRAVRHSDAVPGWTLLWDEVDKSLRPTPGYRTLWIYPVKDWEEIIECLRPMAGRIQGMEMAISDHPCLGPPLIELLETGFSRVSMPGEMQSPPLEWKHDENPFFPVR